MSTWASPYPEIDTELDHEEILARLENSARENQSLRTEIACLRNEIAGLKENFNHRMTDFIAEVTTLTDLIPRKSGFRLDFPTRYKMITGQLFHNKPNKTGKRGGHHPSKWTMKVCFWVHSTDIQMYEDGTVDPYYFTMRPPADTTPKRPNSYLNRCIDSGMELIGCRGIKGSGKADGTQLIEDQVVGIFPSESTGRYPARALVIGSCTWDTTVELINPYVTAIDDLAPGIPVERWIRRFE